VFELVPGRAEIRNRDWCMECGACALNCPLEAITVNKGVGCAGAIIGSMFNGGITSCDCGCSVEPAARDKKKKRNAACC
jgi:ferredoxin